MYVENFFARHRVDMSAPDHLGKILEKLGKTGIATLDGLNSQGDTLALARSLGNVYIHPDAQGGAVTTLSPRPVARPEDGHQGFMSSQLNLHTDRSSLPNPPELVITRCVRKAEDGGAALLVDSAQLYQELQKSYPDLLLLLQGHSSVIFRSGNDQLLGAVFSCLPDNRICIRFRYDSVTYFSAPLIDRMPEFLTALDKFTINVPLENNQGYIIQNGRWLHGRTAFTGPREVERVLVCLDTCSSATEQIKLGFAVSEIRERKGAINEE